MAKETSTVRFISMNTRLGYINVKEMCDIVDGEFDREGEPDNIYHAAIVAFGSVYEYVFDDGVTITGDMKKYFEDYQPIWNDGEFETDKTKEEFDAWVDINKQENFSFKNYHVSDNNCSHFTRAASDFLGGNEPEKHSSQRYWMIRNPTLAAVLQVLLKGGATQRTQDIGTITDLLAKLN